VRGGGVATIDEDGNFLAELLQILLLGSYTVKNVVLQENQYLFVCHFGTTDRPEGRAVQDPAGSRAFANWKYAFRKS
jgi:hypothetical protein